MQKLVINLIKNEKKSFFIIEKIKKYRKCPALGGLNQPGIGYLQRPGTEIDCFHSEFDQEVTI